MWDWFITILLILGAVCYLGLRFYRSLSSRNGSSCSGCDSGGGSKRKDEVMIV